jgi:broad specificity phosphatase PhoE
MSLLVMVRHAQASFQSATLAGGDYDQLSRHGEEQARLLGAHFAERRLLFDRVFVGPRRRHVQTAEAAAAVYRERGMAWPEPTTLPELDEHNGQDLLTRFSDSTIQGLNDSRSQPEYLKLFQNVTRRWVRGELSAPDLEGWKDFRARVNDAIHKMTSASGRKATVAVFTSGGPIAATIGMALGIDDEKTLELSWIIQNTAYSDFLFTDGRFSVMTFNAVSHLGKQELLTFI